MPQSKKPFDFTRYKQRCIALKILYFGWDYDGLAEQDSSKNTIEHYLFQALIKTCLIESREKCKYNRCGRTDKGVSSHGQVVNLCIRSNLVDESDPKNLGLFTPDNYNGPSCDNTGRKVEELNYTNMLNNVLPDHIKAIAWAPAKKEFSSRFDCQSRSYCYLFPVGDLCLDSMRKASSYLIGRHDFRNMCSFDLKNGVTTHTRVIESVDIRPIASISERGPNTAREKPELVRDLLDLNRCPSKPNYNRASSLPLCLFDCKYKPEDLPLGWQYDIRSLQNIIKQLRSLWLRYKTKTMLIERSLSDLEQTAMLNGFSVEHNWKDFGLEYDTMSDSKYTSIMKRPRDETLEFKLEQLSKKKKNSSE